MLINLKRDSELVKEYFCDLTFLEGRHIGLLISSYLDQAKVAHQQHTYPLYFYLQRGTVQHVRWSKEKKNNIEINMLLVCKLVKREKTRKKYEVLQYVHGLY